MIISKQYVSLLCGYGLYSYTLPHTYCSISYAYLGVYAERLPCEVLSHLSLKVCSIVNQKRSALFEILEIYT